MITCEAKRSGVWKRMRARPGMCDREMGGERQRRQGGGCGRGGAIVGPQATAERPPRHTRFAHLHLRGRAPPDGPPVVADPDGRRVVGRVAAAARRAVGALVDAHVPHAQRRGEDVRLLARGETCVWVACTRGWWALMGRAGCNEQRQRLLKLSPLGVPAGSRCNLASCSPGWTSRTCARRRRRG